MREPDDGFKKRYVCGQIIVNMPELFHLTDDLLGIWDWLIENKYLDQSHIQNKIHAPLIKEPEWTCELIFNTLNAEPKWTNQQKVLFKLRWS